MCQKLYKPRILGINSTWKSGPTLCLTELCKLIKIDMTKKFTIWDQVFFPSPYLGWKSHKIRYDTKSR